MFICKWMGFYSAILLSTLTTGKSLDVVSACGEMSMDMQIRGDCWSFTTPDRETDSYNVVISLHENVLISKLNYLQ